MAGAPVSPQMGRELERPEWAAAGTLNCAEIQKIQTERAEATPARLLVSSTLLGTSDVT